MAIVHEVEVLEVDNWADAITIYTSKDAVTISIAEAKAFAKELKAAIKAAEGDK